MDTTRFATFVKALASRRSRRGALRAAGVTAASFGLAGRAVVTHARQATPVSDVVEGVNPGWYAAVRRSRFREGVSSEEIAQIVREGFVPIIADVPGFIAYYVIDTGQGEHVTISIFDDPAGPAESSRRSAEWVPGALGELVEGPAAVIAEGEVQVFAAADLTLPAGS